MSSAMFRINEWRHWEILKRETVAHARLGYAIVIFASWLMYLFYLLLIEWINLIVFVASNFKDFLTKL